MGISLPGTKPRRKRSPIHLESFVSSVFPFTAFTHLGLAIVTWMVSSKRLKTGTQYFPVDSMHTSKQSLSISHCLNWKMELLKVENCLLYTSDAADEEDSVDLGGRRIIK